ncbi:MAG TPA: DHHA1 domain-containing protein, partial [Proteiniclasticum sp.]|nr:DHHA1 domain-containing protein [Proteiniclasticum sp.]
KVDIRNISTYIIGFVLGPCFNAAGRLSTAKMTVDLLFSEGEEAKILARELYELNQTRRAMTDEGIILAEEEIRNHKREKDQVIVLKLQDVHESLAGIIAGRVKERYYRPTIVLTKTENGLKGSARSIEEYNIFEGLNHSKDFLTRFGGHPMAAGLTLDEDKLDSFRLDLQGKAQLNKEDLIPKVTIDAKLNPAIITEKFITSLSRLEPFGKANPKPIFAEKNLLIQQVYLMGKDKDHLKLVFNVEGVNVEGVYFYGAKHIGDYIREVHKREVGDLSMELKNTKCDILYYPDMNTYNGISKVQLKITDLRIT